MSSDNRIIIFDTTLRDGEQALPQSLSARQKLQIALALEELGVDVLEAGFPISSKGDFESVSQIAATLKKTIPCGLSRCVAKDIEAAGEALRVAERFRIHTFIATSTIHVRDKLRKSFDDIVEMAKASVKLARNYTDDVEFSCEDAGRTPIDELCRMVEAAIDAGATTINIPDTVGYTLPTEFGGIITNIFNRVPNIDKAVLSVHCHNDLGMATANSLTAVQMGARQIECCMTGLGERAGCEVIRHEEGADPAAVVFDAVKAAIARNVDVLFIDTAGRLHNKTNLMNELEKVHRIIKREIPEAPHETFLVLDATTGQNAINQAKVFMETANVTGVVLTKLDGTAKGGVVIAIKEELGLPVKWIGVGEGIMDFRPFEADKFVDALFDGDK